MPLFLILSLLPGCSLNDPAPAKLENTPFRICMGGILAPLPLIAKGKGFFLSEGVAAEITILGDGKAAMSGFLEGKCDAVLSGEFPVVRQSFERKDLSTIATLSSSENAVKILARKDRGIEIPADLAGKKIGVSKGTISNYFLDQFIKKNGLLRGNLTISDLSHQVVADALQRGDIDAYAGSDVAYLKGRQLIGDRGVTFTEPGLTSHAACLTVKKEWLSAHGEIATRVLKALIKAEKELELHPGEQISMLSRTLKLPPNDLEKLMSEQHNTVSLYQVLILAMEDEARWMLETGIVKGKPVPNFLHVIDPAVLRVLSPAAVKLK